MLLIPRKSLYLENFGWFDYVRPLSKDDVFNWRGKKQGTELVYQQRKPMPLPNRGLQNTIKNSKKTLPISQPISTQKGVSVN